MSGPQFHGLLVLDKPGGISSREVVDHAKGWFPRGTRVGHTGTLDPLATGVLVLTVGAATRLAEYVQRMDKVYCTRLLLGARSDTDDADGTITPVPGARPPDREAITVALKEFVGEVEQLPPSYSAVKVAGRRAYDLARRGKNVRLPPRCVQVYHLELLEFAYPRLTLKVHCGKGTYIRSLARDLGERLGCGALVETLRRTRIGPFVEADALKLDADAATARSRLLPLSAALDQLPRVMVSAVDAARLRQGQALPLTDLTVVEPVDPLCSEIGVYDSDGNVVAVATLDREHNRLRPRKVLPAPTARAC